MSEQVLPEGVKAVVDSANRRPTKIDQKRQQIFMDRLNRKVASGMSQDQAVQAIAREDYETMPVEKKLARLESMVTAVLQHMPKDIMALRQNDAAIAEAFDINYKAIEKMFAKLGLTGEQQIAIIQEARAEVAAEREKAMREQAEAQKKMEEEAEKARVEGELHQAETNPLEAAKQESTEPIDPHIQQGATVFGS